MKLRMGSPKRRSAHANAKKRAPRAMTHEMTKNAKLMWATPARMVTILIGGKWARPEVTSIKRIVSALEEPRSASNVSSLP